MALSNEDKKDVAVTFGKKAADAVSSATRDRKYKGSSITEHSGATGKREYQTSDYNIGRRGTLKDVKREISLHTSKSKALKSKTGGFKSYQPDQMYSDAAMKRFSAKRKRLGHND